MDSIIARGLTFHACHGVEAQEKTNPQTFKVDLEMYLDLETAGQTDELSNTIDYGEACRLAEKVVTETSCNLIEALAENIARNLLLAFPLLTGVEVTVYKPEAPIEAEFEYFAVKITRCRK
jgi:dihydroneopterin aldolase